MVALERHLEAEVAPCSEGTFPTFIHLCQGGPTWAPQPWACAHKASNTIWTQGEPREPQSSLSFPWIWGFLFFSYQMCSNPIDS